MPNENVPCVSGEWCWLQPGVDEASVRAMFEAIYLLSMTLARYTLSGKEAARAYFASRDETLFLRLEARSERPGFLRLQLHIARDEETLRAWREGLIGERQITIRQVLRRELPTAGVLEWQRLGSEPYECFPEVRVGIGHRMPTADEWQLAARAIEAFNLLHDSLADARDGLQRRDLANGDEVFIETLEPELDAFPDNDGGFGARSQSADPSSRYRYRMAA